jgi:zinc protease
MHRRHVAAVLALALLIAAASPAALARTSTDAVVAATLENGLRVLLLEDRRSPIVSFQVWYRVGSRNERRGASGIAHFLEHMLFKGTPRHGRGEFARLIEQNGGQDNAFTSHDVTSYFVNIGADKLDLVIALEADRMRNALLDPKEIESEREVIIEERRTRTEDDPGGFLAEEVGSIAFRAHPYGFPVIGWAEDLRRITREEIRTFYDAYYVPNNAIVVAVGDLDPTETLARIRAAFGAIPRGPDPPPVLAVEPPQTGDRRVVVRKEAQLPIVYMAWPVPNHRSPDAFALEVLAQVLSAGRTSRLYRHLVYERQLALSAGGDYSYFSLDPNLFWFWATPMPGQTPEAVEAALLAEMERLRTEPVSDVELERAKNQIEASFVFQEDSVHRRNSLLARFELIGGYAEMDRFVPGIRAVTAADLLRVAGAYFPADRKNVGVLLPQP